MEPIKKPDAALDMPKKPHVTTAEFVTEQNPGNIAEFSCPIMETYRVVTGCNALGSPPSTKLTPVNTHVAADVIVIVAVWPSITYLKVGAIDPDAQPDV